MLKELRKGGLTFKYGGSQENAQHLGSSLETNGTDCIVREFLIKPFPISTSHP